MYFTITLVVIIFTYKKSYKHLLISHMCWILRLDYNSNDMKATIQLSLNIYIFFVKFI